MYQFLGLLSSEWPRIRPLKLLTWHLSVLEGINMHSDNCMPVTDYRNYRRAVCV